jgi:hypothetical protein
MIELVVDEGAIATGDSDLRHFARRDVLAEQGGKDGGIQDEAVGRSGQIGIRLPCPHVRFHQVQT